MAEQLLMFAVTVFAVVRAVLCQWQVEEWRRRYAFLEVAYAQLEADKAKLEHDLDYERQWTGRLIYAKAEEPVRSQN